LGFGGYPYYYSPHSYGYYGYDPYYYGSGYDPYAYDGGYSAAPPQQNYGYPPQDQRQAAPPVQQQPPPQRQSAPQRQPENQPPPMPRTQPQSSEDNEAQWPGAELDSRDSSNRGQYYLIAFTDHTIKVATAYKVEGDQFYWMDKDNGEYHVPLSTVDVPFSQQINRDRQVNFQLP
jgi:hypothetical protein